ncbi:MAG: hypothetical protein LUD50_02585 [Clostridia bacterium]|nr:hypothetical protein [Clostridia bacterium]
MPRYITVDKKKDSIVKVRLSPKYREYIEEASYDAGMNISEYIRRLICADALDNNEDLEED